MVDLGQKKVNSRLPFFMRYSEVSEIGVASIFNFDFISRFGCRAVSILSGTLVYLFLCAILKYPKSGWRAFSILISFPFLVTEPFQIRFELSFAFFYALF